MRPLTFASSSSFLFTSWGALALFASAVPLACYQPPPKLPDAVAIEGVASVKTVAPPAPPPPSFVVKKPCVSAPDIAAARETIEALSQRVQALDAAASPKPIADDLAKLLSGPCFALKLTPLPAFDSGLALKTWWEAGGNWWVANQTTLGENIDHTWIAAPTSRRALARDLAPTHQLLPLFCEAKDALPNTKATCGAETAGWFLRAERSLAIANRAKREDDQHTEGAEPPATLESCTRRALATGAPEKMRSYVSCIERMHPRRDALPLGHFKAPTEGWLVMRGRRGGKRGCSEVRAYDLASGSAYIASDCKDQRLVTGQLPIEPLREAALMTLLAPLSNHDAIIETVGLPFPKEIPIVAPDDTGGAIMSGALANRSTLEVSWVRAKGAARTTLTWPESFHPVGTYAATLLAVAEAALVPAACPSAKLPVLKWEALGPALERESAVPTFKDAPYPALQQDLDDLRARPCRPAAQERTKAPSAAFL